jgi:hypothetical protein
MNKDDTSYNAFQWYVNCHLYALIDKDDSCNLFIKWSYPKDSIRFYKIKIDKELIDSVISASYKISEDIIVRREIDTHKISLYDGPSLKIRINNGSTHKTYSFIDSNDNSMKISYVRLFHYLTSLAMTGTVDTISKNPNLSKRKDEILNYIVKTDTIILPLPPKPSQMEQKTRYSIPVILK